MYDNTYEAYLSQVSQQRGSAGRPHGLAQARLASAQVVVHISVKKEI
jgi:hypothetical protein